MQKKTETKKLSIDVLTVRPLASELTAEQLRAVTGGHDRSSGSRANC